jgi:hypothetical protein
MSVLETADVRHVPYSSKSMARSTASLHCLDFVAYVRELPNIMEDSSASPLGGATGARTLSESLCAMGNGFVNEFYNLVYCFEVHPYSRCAELLKGVRPISPIRPGLLYAFFSACVSTGVKLPQF